MDISPIRIKSANNNFIYRFEKYYEQLQTNFNKCSFNKVIKEIEDNKSNYTNNNNVWIFHDLYLNSCYLQIKKYFKKFNNLNSNRKLFIQDVNVLLHKIKKVIEEWKEELNNKGKIEHLQKVSNKGLLNILSQNIVYNNNNKICSNKKIINKSVNYNETHVATKECIKQPEYNKFVSNTVKFVINSSTNNENTSSHLLSTKCLNNPKFSIKIYSSINYTYTYQKEKIIYHTISLLYLEAQICNYKGCSNNIIYILSMAVKLFVDYVSKDNQIKNIFVNDSYKIRDINDFDQKDINIISNLIDNSYCTSDIYNIMGIVFINISFELIRNRDFTTAIFYNNLSFKCIKKELVYKQVTNNVNFSDNLFDRKFTDICFNRHTHKSYHELKNEDKIYLIICISMLYRGICYENFYDSKDQLLKAIESYKQAKWFSLNCLDDSYLYFKDYLNNIVKLGVELYNEKYVKLNTTNLLRIKKNKIKCNLKSLENKVTYYEKLQKAKYCKLNKIYKNIKDMKFIEPLEVPIQYSKFIDKYTLDFNEINNNEFDKNKMIKKYSDRSGEYDAEMSKFKQLNYALSSNKIINLFLSRKYRNFSIPYFINNKKIMIFKYNKNLQDKISKEITYDNLLKNNNNNNSIKYKKDYLNSSVAKICFKNILKDINKAKNRKHHKDNIFNRQTKKLLIKRFVNKKYKMHNNIKYHKSNSILYNNNNNNSLNKLKNYSNDNNCCSLNLFKTQIKHNSILKFTNNKDNKYSYNNISIEKVIKNKSDSNIKDNKNKNNSKNINLLNIKFNKTVSNTKLANKKKHRDNYSRNYNSKDNTNDNAKLTKENKVINKYEIKNLNKTIKDNKNLLVTLSDNKTYKESTNYFTSPIKQEKLPDSIINKKESLYNFASLSNNKFKINTNNIDNSNTDRLSLKNNKKFIFPLDLNITNKKNNNLMYSNNYLKNSLNSTNKSKKCISSKYPHLQYYKKFKSKIQYLETLENKDIAFNKNLLELKSQEKFTECIYDTNKIKKSCKDFFNRKIQENEVFFKKKELISNINSNKLSINTTKTEYKKNKIINELILSLNTKTLNKYKNYINSNSHNVSLKNIKVSKVNEQVFNKNKIHKKIYNEKINQISLLQSKISTIKKML